MIRRRAKPTTGDPSHSSSVTQSSQYEKNKQSAAIQHYFVLTVFVIAVIGIALSFVDRVPTPRKASNTPLHEFSEERAMQFLKPLAQDVRVAGTSQNEVEAVKYILDHLEGIKESGTCKQSGTCPEMEVSVQHPNGSYVIKFLNNFLINKYTNIVNIAVRISPRNSRATEKGSILLNSHFDSAIGAKGASDAGALCAVMAEILRVLRNSDETQFEINYPMIFLFNGAEETVMMAAQGFITQHPWAQDIKLVMNMDSTGTGAAALFQLTSDRVLRAYAKAAPHPHGNSFGLDFFRSGKFPGDTDFRIFRDYGAVPGADFAYYRNGYVYHTVLDDVPHMKPGSLQHMGENILSTLQELSRSKALDYPETTDITVFFDFFGKYMFYFTEFTSNILSGGSLVFALAVLSYNPTLKKFDVKRNFAKIIIPFLSILVGVVLAFVFSIGTGFLMKYLQPMTWYSHQWMVVPLYSAPAVIGLLIPSVFLHSYISRQYSSGTQPNQLVLANITAQVTSSVLLFYTILLAAAFNLGSSFFFLISVTALSLGVVATFILPQPLSHYIYLGFIGIPMLFFTDFTIGILELLIPVMGRGGPGTPAEIIIPLFTTLPTILFSLFLLPLCHSHPKHKQILKVLLAVLCIAVVSSFFIFPYSRDTPKRFFVQHHTQLKNSSNAADPVYTLMFAQMDTVSGAQYLDDMHHRFVDKGKQHTIYREEARPTVRSDFAMLFPLDRLFSGVAVRSTAPVLVEGGEEVKWPVLDILSDTYSSEDNIRTLKFNITYAGMEWSTLSFRANLTKWDILEDIPFSETNHFFIRHVGGAGINTWQSTYSFLGNDPISFNVTGIHFGFTHLTREVIENLPDWATAVSPVTSAVEYTI